MGSRLHSYLCITAFFFFFPATGATAYESEKKLSLSDCISIALEKATSAKKAEYNLKLQGADVLRSYGNFLPKISVSAAYSPYVLNRTYTQYNYGDIARIKTESESIDLTLTTSLNLFNGFRDFAALQSALNRQDAARFSLSRALQSIAYDVTQSYFQVLLNRELLDIARENLLSSKDQLTLTDRQFQIGLKSITDLNQQQADTAESALNVIKSETRLQRSMLELIRRLQIDPQTKISLEPAPDEIKVPVSSKLDIDSLAPLALERRNDLKSRYSEANAAKWQIIQARASWLPRLDLIFSVTTGGTGFIRQSINSGPETEYAFPPLSDQLGNSIGYSVALNLSWTLFDGFQTRYNVEAAKINHINQRLDYQDLKNNILIDLRQAAGDYNAAFTEIETAKVRLKAAESAFAGIKRKYELGAAGFVELSTARAALFNARSGLSQANFNLLLQKNIVDFTTGNLSVQ
ncbi:MAG: TolC family protein [Chlorobium sp.]|nr:MAG: TolC family protein [Chlorobium sp.]